MNSILAAPDVLNALQMKKRAKRREIRQSQKRLSDAFRKTVSPLSKASESAHGIERAISKGILIYKGFRIGHSAFTTLRNLFGGKRRRY